LIRKPDGKRPNGGYRQDLIGSEMAPMVGFYKHGDVSSGFIKVGDRLWTMK
jgi:hypothetical protein